MTDINSLNAARRVVENQPFTKWLGAKLVRFGAGKAVFEMEVRDDHKQHRGVVHGGVLSALADTAIAFAAGSRMGPRVATQNVTVNFVRPVHDGTLIAEAEAVHVEHRVSVVRCLLLDEARALYATGVGTVRLTGDE